MAERARPPVAPPASSSSPPEHSDSSSSTAVVAAGFGSPLQPAALPAPPGHTYVVKVQKDQVFRVPPPENAYLAERYRNERAGGGGKAAGSGASCTPCVMRTLGALLVTALLVGAAVAIALVVLRPDLPGFAVDRLSVHNATRPPNRLQFDVFLTAVNPNKMTALWYKDGGTVRLLHQGTALAKGGLGEPVDGGEDAKDFSPQLHPVQPRDGRTPKVLEAGVNGSRDPVALHLAVEVTVQVHIGALGFGQRKLTVDCGFTAAGLRKETHVSSQKCKSTFRN